MTVDRHHAQALTTLAIACRPNGAPHWDEAGVMAAIGKVRHLALADVALAVIRAADDREARTPGGIANTSSPHWRERGTDRPQRPVVVQAAERCSTCQKPKHRCEGERLADDDHTFRPDFRSDRPAVNVGATVAGLKDLVAHAETPEPTPAAEPGTSENVNRLRESAHQPEEVTP